MEIDNFTLAMSFLAQEERRDVPACYHPGCQQPSIECVVSDPEGEDHYEYYCPEHAPEYGYCSVCGMFMAGTEDDMETICDMCRDQLRSEAGEYDEEEWEEREYF